MTYPPFLNNFRYDLGTGMGMTFWPYETYVKRVGLLHSRFAQQKKLNYRVTFLLKTKQEIVNFSIEVLINIES